MQPLLKRFACLTQRWKGVWLLLVGSMAGVGSVVGVVGVVHAAAPGAAPAGAPASAHPPALRLATAEVLALAEAQAGETTSLPEQAARCTRNHRHGVRYTVQHLITPVGATASTSALNNHGWVVGRTFVGNRAVATLWQGGMAYDLGGSGSDTGANDINDAGQVVGTATGANRVISPVTWYRGRMSILPKPRGIPDHDAIATSINRSGAIAGYGRSLNAPHNWALVWNNGRVRTLPGLGPLYSVALKIEDSGVVLGASDEPSAPSRQGAFWTPAGRLTDLGAGIAYDANRHGSIVGATFNEAYMTPLRWVRRVRTTVPTLGGRDGAIRAVNDRDEAVGWSLTALRERRGTIWFGAAPVQLDTLLENGAGITIDDASDINERGQIAASGRVLGDDVFRPILLTPRRCHGG